MYKTIGVIVLLAIGLGAYFFMRNNPKPQEDNSKPAEQTQKASEETPVPDKAVAVVETSEGTFEITLDGKAAPKTVANFIKLSNEGFYNNLTFHRIEQTEGFHLIQGGDPSGDGTGGPGYTIPAEIGLKHTKGAVATARTGDQFNPTRASSGSQFYITLEDIPQLDGQYTVFGYVTSGMDVVEKIGKTEVVVDGSTGMSIPIKDIVIKKITIKE